MDVSRDDEPRRAGTLDFGDQVAIVSGGGSGIGAATARLLHQFGATVASLDVEYPNPDQNIMEIEGDVTDQSSVDAAVNTVVGECGHLNVLVNSAGVGATGSVEDNDDDECLRVFDVNVLGIVRMSRAAIPLLRRESNGAVVNVCSVAATVGLPQRALYSASKGAVLSLTLAMAADLLEDGIRVNCVTPGTIDTPWVGRLLEKVDDPGRHRAALEARQPMGRLGTAEEVAGAIAWLAAPATGFVTGVALPVDGGMMGVRVPSGVKPR